MATAEAPARPGARGRLLGLLGAVVSVVVLALVVAWALGQDAPSLPDTSGRLGALAGAVALYFVAAGVRGERWLVLLRENGARPRRADAYALVVVGYMGNNVLPARAGDALRAVLMPPRAGTDARTVIGTLIAERLCDVLVLVLLFVLLAYGVLTGAAVDLGDRVGLLVALAVAGAVLAAAAGIALWRTGRLARVVAFLRPVIAAPANLLRGRHGAEVLALTVLTWSLEGLVWHLTAVAADLGTTLTETLYLLALSSIFVMVPAGPGQAGTMDAAIVLGTRALGRSGGAALTYLLLLRFVLMVPITIAGAVLTVTRYGGWGRLRAALGR
jgi:hypothetical protein